MPKEGRKPITGEMASEGGSRKRLMQHGCNAFDKTEPKSTPWGFGWNKTSGDICASSMYHTADLRYGVSKDRMSYVRVPPGAISKSVSEVVADTPQTI